MVRATRILLGFLLAACFAAPGVAGTTAEIRGHVTDAEGKPLPGVTLIVRNDSLSLAERGAVTDAGGRFRIPQLPPGAGYRLRASLPTYAPLEFSDITLDAEQTYVLDISLRPASDLRQTIRVKGQTQVVNTESVATTTSFSSELIAGLPVLGHDYQDILTLAPGVTDVNGTGNPNVHGARDTGMVTLVDGMSTTDPFTGYYGQSLNIESIAEVEVITSGAPAEFSRAQGGFANIVTKSGGNEFKGTFKFFMRHSKLDGDGAGVDNPELHGGLAGAKAFSELHFADYYPFLSFSGPFRKDHVWYYITGEYFQFETPMNDLTQAFVVGTRGHREFAKTSWQITPTHKVTFSLDMDHTTADNQGITSQTDLGSGYSLLRGGPTYTLKETAVLGPDYLLESSASLFDNSFQRVPTTDPDSNHNGILYVDFNHDGIYQASERDPGEDWDRDGRYDIAEYEGDLDGDGRFTRFAGCEGYQHEDVDCDGHLDEEVDSNMNGKLDYYEDTGLYCNDPYRCTSSVVPGTRRNGKFDTEDTNGNGVLDVVGDSGLTPYPFWVDANGNGLPDRGEFRAPLPPDVESFTDQYGRTYGPDPYQYQDHRKRFSWREDFSIYVPDFGGVHDVKMGAVYEHEGFDSDTLRRAEVAGGNVLTGWPANVNNTALGDNVGIYLQDTYKPLPNLTLGLGVRFDFESLRSFGYQPFDPRAEREAFDALQIASGVVSPDPNIHNVGLCADPAYPEGCSDPRLAAIQSSLRNLLPVRLTRHNSEYDIRSDYLKQVLGRDVTIEDLLAAGYNIRQPEDIRWSNNNLAPRLSVSWDPTADGKSKAFASWSRFYDKLFLNSVVLEEGPDLISRLYRFDADGLTDWGWPDNHLGRAISQAAPSIYQISRSLSTPYTDEFTLGFERELAPELSLSVSYIRRNYEKQLQDTDINHHTRINPVTGRPADVLGEQECGLNCGQAPDGLPDLYIENFLFNQVLLLENSNRQTYRGYELELTRRLSRKWQMHASYTYSKSKGDAESYLSTLGNDPSVREYESGYMDYDQRHVVKFDAIAYLPGDWRLGGIAQWASGLPYSIVIRRQATDDVGYVQDRLIYGELGPQGIIREGRNFHRNKAVYDFNARVEKEFIMGRASASAFFEIYNLLNSDDLRVKTIESKQRGSAINGEIGPIAAQHIFLVDGTRRFGRRYQVGIKIDF